MTRGPGVTAYGVARVAAPGPLTERDIPMSADVTALIPSRPNGRVSAGPSPAFYR